MIDGWWKPAWETSWWGGSLGQWPQICIRVTLIEKCCYCNTAGDKLRLAGTAAAWLHERANHLRVLRAFEVVGLTVVNKRTAGLGGEQSNQFDLKGGEGWGKPTGFRLMISLSGSELQLVRLDKKVGIELIQTWQTLDFFFRLNLIHSGMSTRRWDQLWNRAGLSQGKRPICIMSFTLSSSCFYENIF